MARNTLQMELPEDVMKQFQHLAGNADDMLGKMTLAGAKAVQKRMAANLPPALRASKNFPKSPTITRTYKTPSDDGINNKVAFYGYFENSRGVKTPVPLVANLFEFGSSTVRKQPFVRKSFDRGEITKVMLAEQERILGELTK